MDSSFIPGDQHGAADEDTGTHLDENVIQPTYAGEAACTTFGRKLRQFLLDADTPPPPPRPKYYKNVKLLRASSTDCQLPNQSDARLLVRVVLRFVGADYHFLRRKSFLEKLEETYLLPALEEPIWLCRLFTVFALGEVYSVRASRQKGQGVPGTAFFLKALEFFQDLYEEPTVEYIETLVLLVSILHLLFVTIISLCLRFKSIILYHNLVAALITLSILCVAISDHG